MRDVAAWTRHPDQLQAPRGAGSGLLTTGGLSGRMVLGGGWGGAAPQRAGPTPANPLPPPGGCDAWDRGGVLGQPPTGLGSQECPQKAGTPAHF